MVSALSAKFGQNCTDQTDVGFGQWYIANLDQCSVQLNIGCMRLLADPHVHSLLGDYIGCRLARLRTSWSLRTHLKNGRFLKRVHWSRWSRGLCLAAIRTHGFLQTISCTDQELENRSRTKRCYAISVIPIRSCVPKPVTPGCFHCPTARLRVIAMEAVLLIRP
jgi:hypothetical protein